MPQQTYADFTLLDSKGQIGLLVEVKRRWDMTQNKAIEHHAWCLERLASPLPFLLLTPTLGYLWSARSAGQTPPDAVLDLQAELAPYFQRANITPQQVQPFTFELLASRWLSDLIEGKGSHQSVYEALKSVGADSIQGGRLLVEHAA